MGMKLDRIKDLFDDPGPFASAYAEVSRAQHDGDTLAELAARAAYDDLVGQGAPEGVSAQVRDRLAASTHRPAPVSRCVVVSERGVLLDELTAVHRPQPRHSWGALPDLASWVQDASLVVPYVLALVDHTGGRVQTFADGSPRPEREAEITDDSDHVQKVSAGGWSAATVAAVDRGGLGPQRRGRRCRKFSGRWPAARTCWCWPATSSPGSWWRASSATCAPRWSSSSAVVGRRTAATRRWREGIREVLRGRLITERLDRLRELGQQRAGAAGWRSAYATWRRRSCWARWTRSTSTRSRRPTTNWTRPTSPA